MISTLQYTEMLLRTSKNKVREPAAAFEPCEKETGKGGLQEQIQNWCDAQWPRWVCDFPRTDLKSTLPLGRHDSTIWGPYPICFLIETKANGKKRTHDQLIWKTRMAAIGWEVELIYSLEQFLELVKPSCAPK